MRKLIRYIFFCRVLTFRLHPVRQSVPFEYLSELINPSALMSWWETSERFRKVFASVSFSIHSQWNDSPIRISVILLLTLRFSFTRRQSWRNDRLRQVSVLDLCLEVCLVLENNNKKAFYWANPHFLPLLRQHSKLVVLSNDSKRWDHIRSIACGNLEVHSEEKS